jgi:hypothetical protein
MIKKDIMKNVDETQSAQRTPTQEYEDLMKMAEIAGISDLMKLYGEYRKLIDMSDEYLQQLSPTFSFSTTDSST